MSLLSSVSIKNFMCFRSEIKFSLAQGTYVIGINNAGKTAMLNAIHFFFNNELYGDESFLNRSEYLAKKAKYNQAEISIIFNLNEIKSKALQVRLIKLFGSKTAQITKVIRFTPSSGSISFYYQTAHDKMEKPFETLDPDIKKLINSVKITYIHPQSGKELLLKAQGKLRERLLANWGRNPKLSRSISELQNRWEVLRKQARIYLSSSLTDNLQKMWPESVAAIDLPRDIKDIVAISDITFKGSQNLPEIELTLQGTGAQSAILYYTHYLLDSDRSLHRGEYHSVWLLEEPESFLHADLIIKFSQELNSELWLKNIQMVVSTHSPMILAASHQGGDEVFWDLIDTYQVKKGKKVSAWVEEEIDEIGKIMGDSNFSVYFSASKNENLIFLEDSRELEKKRFVESGVKVYKGLEGISQVARHIDVLLNSPDFIQKKVFFLVDGDEGIEKVKRFFQEPPEIEKDEFKKYLVKGSTNMFVITLPEGLSAEDLFEEYDVHLEVCIDKIWNIADWSIKSSIPSELTRACARARGAIISSSEQAKKFLKKEQDVKDSFWREVDSHNYSINKNIITILKSLLI